MGKSISFESAGILLLASKNTVIGYSTARMGKMYSRVDGGVPYEVIPDLLRFRISSLKKRKNLEKELETLRKHHYMVINEPFENVVKYINSIRENLGEKEKGLSEKVLEPEEKEIPEPPEPEIKEQEPSPKYEEPESSESPVYQPKIEYKEESEKKIKETRQRQYSLTERELNMPLDKLVDITLGKINTLKKSIKANPTLKKQEELANLEMKYRSIYTPWKQGILK